MAFRKTQTAFADERNICIYHIKSKYENTCFYAASYCVSFPVYILVV